MSSGRKLSVPGNGAKDTATFDLQAGTYTYFCDIAGHRGAGMEGNASISFLVNGCAGEKNRACRAGSQN